MENAKSEVANAEPIACGRMVAICIIPLILARAEAVGDTSFDIINMHVQVNPAKLQIIKKHRKAASNSHPDGPSSLLASKFRKGKGRRERGHSAIEYW